MAPGAEVAVIGCGVIGLSIAWRLAEGGVRVCVYDAGQIGREASWAGAGMLAPGGEIEAPDEWSRFALASLALYPAFVDQLRRESGLSVDFRRCGAFQVAFAEKEAEELTLRAEVQASAGIFSESAPVSGVPGVSTQVVAARFYPDDSVVNPRDLIRALRLCCERSGVQIREHERVHRIDDGYPAEIVVLAAGAWSSAVDIHVSGAAVRLAEAFPVRGHLIAFDNPTVPGDAILRHGHTYLLRRAEGAVIAGSSTEQVGFEREIDGGIAAELAARAARLVPLLGGLPYTVWNGLRPATLTGQPSIGRVPGSNVWLAYGHYRNGILLAPATAERIAGEIMQASSQTGSSSPNAHPRSDPAHGSAA